MDGDGLQAVIVGCGVIAPNHLAGYRADPRVTTVGACDLVPERAAALADGGPVYPDHRAVCADPAVDIVSVCTPHPSHAEIACAAMAAGKHVICEKPLGVRPEAITAMLAAAETAAARGVVASGIFQHRFSPLARRLRELLHGGTFGPVTDAACSFACRRDAAYYDADAWRGTWAHEGGGVLINQAIHSLDLWLWFLGEPRRVAGRVANRRHRGLIEVEDEAEATVDFADGTRGRLTAVNADECVWTPDFSIMGEHGRFTYSTNANGTLVELEHEDPDLVTELRRLEAHCHRLPELPGKACYGALHGVQIGAVLDAVVASGPSPLPFAEAAVANQAILALYHATAVDAAVELPLDDYRVPDLLADDLQENCA